jgi:hypothetical protein
MTASTTVDAVGETNVLVLPLSLRPFSDAIGRRVHVVPRSVAGCKATVYRSLISAISFDSGAHVAQDLESGSRCSRYLEILL